MQTQPRFDKNTLRPRDICTKKFFFDSIWQNTETEVTARWLVRLCQKLDPNRWVPFTFRELTAFYQEGRLRSIQKDWDREERNGQHARDIEAGYHWRVKPRPTSCDETFCFNQIDEHYLTFGGELKGDPKWWVIQRLTPDTVIDVKNTFVAALAKYRYTHRQTIPLREVCTPDVCWCYRRSGNLWVRSFAHNIHVHIVEVGKDQYQWSFLSIPWQKWTASSLHEAKMYCALQARELLNFSADALKLIVEAEKNKAVRA